MSNRTRFWKKRIVFFASFLAMLCMALPAVAQSVPGGTLDPATIPKFADQLPVPGTMPKAAKVQGADYYEIALQQIQQQVLPASMRLKTTVWGYGPKGGHASWPAATIEAKTDTPVRVRWINDLKDRSGKYLKHLFAVDQTLHWANPPKDCIDTAGVADKTDCKGKSQDPYRGPVPMVPHLHGAHVQSDSDGYPEAWFLPDASNIPFGYGIRGSKFSSFRGTRVDAGETIYQYPNTQRAATLWYHDHVLGMTRLNVYAGAAGFYVLRGGSSDLPPGRLPSGAYEIPLLIQDRSFNSNGSLFFPDNRAFFEGLNAKNVQPEQFPFTAILDIPFIPDPTAGGQSDVSPIWNPEFFGNTITVNGKTWPFLNVEPRRYRLRLLNGCNARTMILQFSENIPVWQIGADGGFLPAPVQLDQILIAPAERMDIIVDFTGIKSGAKINLLNIGPDSPFGGGEPNVDFPPSDPNTTGQVMQFKVVRQLHGKDNSIAPAKLKLPARSVLGESSNTRKVSLNELSSGQEMNPGGTVWVPVDPETGGWLARNGIVSQCVGDDFKNFDCQPFGPTEGILGIVDENGNSIPKEWMDQITENPNLGATETWEILNFTEDAHPIHLHQVQFEVVNRQPIGSSDSSLIRPPEAGETGTKDTLLAYPGEITRLKAKFDIPGLYVWHCHILDHEDNEMMRPLFVGPIPPNL